MTQTVAADLQQLAKERLGFGGKGGWWRSD
jgi:hypothetical protein